MLLAFPLYSLILCNPRDICIPVRTFRVWYSSVEIYERMKNTYNFARWHFVHVDIDPLSFRANNSKFAIVVARPYSRVHKTELNPIQDKWLLLLRFRNDVESNRFMLLIIDCDASTTTWQWLHFCLLISLETNPSRTNVNAALCLRFYTIVYDSSRSILLNFNF